MKNKLKQLISALLVILMIVSIFTACKKEQESDTIDDVEETTEAPAIEAEKQFTPSNTFYSKNTSKNTNDEEYKIEIVDDKVYFTERDGGNYTNILEASGTYTIDENGNYILDLCRLGRGKTHDLHGREKESEACSKNATERGSADGKRRDFGRSDGSYHSGDCGILSTRKQKM